MPPSRRHSRTTTPPTRRPRVAGLRRPSATDSATTDTGPVSEVETPEPETDTGYTPPVWREVDKHADEPEEDAEPFIAEPVIDSAPDDTLEETVDETAAEPAVGVDEVVEVVEERPAPRPSGKRRSLGSTQPADLAQAEAEVSESDLDEGPPTNPRLVRAITLGVAVLILAALAVWFRGEANSRSEGADADNQALINTESSVKVVGQVRDAIEKSLTYNYTDLESTAKAVQENLSGRALCEYDQLFGQVKKLAPEQKLVLTTRVREIGVTRLQGDLATLLVFVDQTTTRADQNQTTASGAQFAVRAEQQGGKWKITQFDMLGQPLPNGQPLPQC